MKKIIILTLFVFVSISSIQGQVDVVGGMGISFVASPSLNDYLNYNISSSDELGTFNTTAEFYAEIDYTVSPKFQIGFEYVYAIYGYSTTLAIYSYELDYNHLKPSILGYYVVNGEGYKFKFGGGIGLRTVELTESINTTDEGAQKFTANGFGILGRVQGHTTLGGKLYVNIGSTIRYDAPGVPENGDNKFQTPTNEDINLNSFSVSVDIGISYFF